MTWRTSEDLKNDVRDIAGRFLRGLVRRYAITLTDGTKWRFSGMRSSSGGDETPDLEVFPGIGIYARPPNDGTGNPEGIAVAVGGAKHRVAIATRDEATRQAALADDVQPGETCVYNGRARLIVTADGHVEIRLHGGVAQPTIMGQTYRSAEDSYFSAVNSMVNDLAAAIAALAAASPTLTGTPVQVTAWTSAVTALATAATAFSTAVTTFGAGAASYLTTVLKVE